MSLAKFDKFNAHANMQLFGHAHALYILMMNILRGSPPLYETLVCIH